MRLIKFRAWAHASKIMFYPDGEDGWNIEKGKLPPLPNTTLMQYTGLKDENGKEIYEGDIVSNNSLNYSHEKLIITFVDGAFCVGLIFAAKFSERITIRDAMSIAKHHDMELVLEVLGNIHENPELFKCEDN